MTKQTIITTAAVTTGAVILISTIAIAYQSLVVVPREEIRAEAERYERERREEALASTRREDKYNSCLVDAYNLYSENWDNYCELLGREPNCSLPYSKSEDLGEDYSSEKATCLTIYKTN